MTKLTQETEDVVGCILRDYENGAMDAAGTIEDLVEYAQSLSDRIDVLKDALNAIIDGAGRRDVKWSGMNAHDIARAALHQEGIDPK